MGKDINLRSKEEQIEFVSKFGHYIQHINNPCLEVQLAAVNNNGFNIQHIKEPYLEAQLVAVNNDGISINYIKNPCYEVQLASIQDLTNVFKWHFQEIKPHITYPDLLELLELKILACE